MDTRDRLVRSAGELLWDRGYVGASPRAIQQHAEAGQGSMYHHFTGKHALAVDAIGLLAEELRQRTDDVLSGPGSAIERIVGYLRMQREPLRGCPLGRLVHDPEVAADPELRRPIEAYLSWLATELTGLLGQAQRDGDIPAALPPSGVASAVIAAAQGSYVLARASADPSAQPHAIDGLIALLTKEP